MKQLILIVLVLTVAACGRHDRFSGATHTPTVARGAPMASGPLSQACMASDRKARSRALCGCIQYVANQTLSGSQQRRAVVFYSNPHRAQEIRQSDRAGDEAFWKAYKDYGERARALCG